jgi:hypothetical protein
MNAPLPENKAGHFAVSVAPGVKIPLPGFSDWKGEYPKISNNEDIHIADADKHAWGFGARAYINYYVTNDFYVNLYNETIIHPFRAKANELGSGMRDYEMKYGPDITFELEPHIDHQITEGVRFGLGIPIEFKYTGTVEYYKDDTFIPDSVAHNNSKGLVSLKPKMSVFFTSLPLPLEILGEYDAPIYGRGALAMHKVIFQLKAYWKIP